jgi:hypothetical protein
VGERARAAGAPGGEGKRERERERGARLAWREKSSSSMAADCAMVNKGSEESRTRARRGRERLTAGRMESGGQAWEKRERMKAQRWE